MANYQQAPTLHHNGAKENGSNNFYKIPQELADIVFNELGNASAQLRIMLVLIGTKPECFNISDKWICERTGLLHPSYIKARKELVNRGWLTHDPAKGITVNFDVIYGKKRSNTTLPEEKKKECSNTELPQRSNTTLPQCSNMELPQCSNMELPIIDKIDNKTNNKIDRQTEPEEKGTFKYPIEIQLEKFREIYNCHEWQEISNVCRIFKHTSSNKYYRIKGV